MNSSNSKKYRTQRIGRAPKRQKGKPPLPLGICFAHVHYDPVSMVKIDYMGGNKDNRRALEDGSDLAWYLELTSSIAKMESKHKKIYSYWIDSQGHCSFGLYYPFQ